MRSNRFAMEQYRPLVAVRTQKVFNFRNAFSIEGSGKVVLSNYQTINKGKSNLVRLLSLSDTEEIVSLHWSKKQPKSVTYLENGVKQKAVDRGKGVTVPAKGSVTLRVEW